LSKKKNTNKKKTEDLSVESLIQQANSALISNQYKEAIVCFKRLLKLDPLNKWRDGLATAYLGRAKDLAGKGMYKDALVLLGNRQQQGNHPETLDLKIIWTLLTGQYRQAIETFYKEKDQLQPNEIEHIETTVALLILSGHDDLLAFIPDGSTLRTDSTTAQLAVRAYCRGDDVELSSLLKKISFRSPYRDIRSILSALSVDLSDLKLGRAKLEKIPEESPFKAAANIAHLAISDDFEANAFEKVSNSACNFICMVRGISKQVYRLMTKILQSTGSVKTFFKALLHHAVSTESPVLQEFCYKLLPYYSGGIQTYQKYFGVLSQFEISRIVALLHEKKGDDRHAGWAWEDASDALAEQPYSEDNRLIRALVLRRAAECCDRFCGGYTEDAEQLLEQSLEYDPDDLPTFLSLFERYKALEDDASYRNCVERALKNFPEDSQVLMASIELAINRNTFKKAARFAKILLKKDSINTRARSLLINAHLSHAGKQIVIGRYDLAVKEIDEAEKMERPGNPSGAIPLYRGILGYAQNNEIQGEAMVEQACRIIGSYVIGYFRVLMEMSRLDIAVRYRKKYDSLLKNITLNKPEKSGFLALIKDFQHYILVEDADPRTTLSTLKKYFTAAVTLDFNRQEMEMICETLQDLDAFQHLNDFADVACQQWVDDPIFVYFMLFAKTGGIPMKLLLPDINRLEWALETAKEQKNIRVSNRLIEYLEQGLDYSVLGCPNQINEGIDESFDSFPPPEISNEMLFDDGDDTDVEVAKPKPRSNRNRTLRDPFTVDMFDD